MPKPPRKGTAPKPAPGVFKLNFQIGGKPMKTVDVKPGCCVEKAPPPEKK